MQMQPTYVNGRYYDHSCLRVSLPFGNNQLLTLHTKSVSYKQEASQNEIHGVHPVAHGFSMGALSVSGDFTFIKEGWESFLAALPQGLALGYLTFNMVLEYVSINDVYPSSRTKFEKLAITSIEHSSTLGTGGLEVKVSFKATQLFEGDNEISLAPRDLDRLINTI